MMICQARDIRAFDAGDEVSRERLFFGELEEGEEFEETVHMCRSVARLFVLVKEWYAPCEGDEQ
jgi:hypothetical protein